MPTPESENRRGQNLKNRRMVCSGTSAQTECLALALPNATPSSTGGVFLHPWSHSRHAEHVKGTLFDSPPLAKAIEEIYRYPLRQSAIDTLNRQLRAGIDDQALADLVLALRDDDRLCMVQEEEQTHEPQIVCSLGLTVAGGQES